MERSSAQTGMKIMLRDDETQMKGNTGGKVEKGFLDADDIGLKMKAMNIDCSGISGKKNAKPVSLNNPATPRKGSAKAYLYEICSMNHWKPPVFECCKEEGPDHNKLFTFKVSAEIKEASAFKYIECYGNSQSNKKAAAENAAEGALWYLKQAGYQRNKMKG